MTTECGCPALDPKDWDLKKHVWQEKAFHVTKHGLFFHMPIGIAKAIARGMEAIKSKGYALADPFLMLDAEIGLFSAKMMLALKEVPSDDPNVEVVRDATVYSKYFKGEFKDLNRPVQELMDHVRSQQSRSIQMYCWYATCPKCWATKGKETVIFARVEREG